jgi:hypothetical protein
LLVAKLGLSEQTATTIATAHHNNIAITNTRYAQLTTILTQLDAAYRKLGDTQRAAILQDTKLNQQAEALAARKKLEEGARNAGAFALQKFFGGAKGLEESGPRDEQDAVLRIIQQIQKETVKLNLSEQDAVRIISNYSKGIGTLNIDLQTYINLLKQLVAQHKKVGSAQREATRQNNQIAEARNFIDQIRTKDEFAIPAGAKPLQAAPIRAMYSELQAAIAKTKLSAANSPP